jgi:2-oxoglutarate dehydrogenase E2 component (dihydrolipoamide succinyltransferase)|tara:strand:- start:546 stop:1835 length:1290 start_codon:yes stop_codon:yes gene_type:complete
MEILVPEMGESIVEATVGQWFKRVGESVMEGEPLVELETDKVNVEVPASSNGVLEKIVCAEGDVVSVSDILGIVQAGASVKSVSASEPSDLVDNSESFSSPEAEAIENSTGVESGLIEDAADLKISPVAKRLADNRGVELSKIEGTGIGGRIVKDDIENYLLRENSATSSAEALPIPVSSNEIQSTPAPKKAAHVVDGEDQIVRLSRRRLTMAERLSEVHHTAVMTTTYNEIDMTLTMDIRKRRKESFQEQYGVNLGFMSFFVKAVIGGLVAYPIINAELQEQQLIYRGNYHIGIAVGSEDGLVVPVLKRANTMTFSEIELGIRAMAEKVKTKKLSLDELQGGTFTITNGGVFGSLMSTPILNYPQVGILGMHSIVQRPIAIDGKVEIRPMMYVALTYDHRVVEGREAVGFLKRVKELIEDPGRLLIES